MSLGMCIDMCSDMCMSRSCPHDCPHDVQRSVFVMTASVCLSVRGGGAEQQPIGVTPPKIEYLDVSTDC